MNARRALGGIVGIVLVAVAGLVSLQLTASLLGRGERAVMAAPELTSQEQADIKAAKRFSQAFAAVVKLVKPAVVNIRVERVVTRVPRPMPFGFEDDPLRRFFGLPSPRRRPQQPQEFHQPVAGSGVIVDAANGYILTNNHVVADADDIEVKLADGRKFEGTIVGTDPPTDLAVISIEGDNLIEAELGDSDVIEVGEWVIAIGNPFALELTVTAGVVSAKGRANLQTAAYEDYIQTDAAINPGNSGGPLVDLGGKVVGINSAILSPTGTFAGYGFAIPSNMAREVMEQLVTKGTVVRGYLGVVIQPLQPEMAEAWGLPKDTKGVAIPQVMPDTPAAKAGIEPYDVVVKFNGKPVTSPRELLNAVAQTPPGTEATITVLRNGKEKTFKITVSTRPSELAKATTPPSSQERLGLVVTDLTDQLARQLGYEGEHGVVIQEVQAGGPADEAGLEAGLLIKAVNKQPVPDVATFRKVIAGLGEAKGVVFLIQDRQGNTRFVVLRLK